LAPSGVGPGQGGRAGGPPYDSPPGPALRDRKVSRGPVEAEGGVSGGEKYGPSWTENVPDPGAGPLGGESPRPDRAGVGGRFRVHSGLTPVPAKGRGEVR